MRFAAQRDSGSAGPVASIQSHIAVAAYGVLLREAATVQVDWVIPQVRRLSPTTTTLLPARPRSAPSPPLTRLGGRGGGGYRGKPTLISRHLPHTLPGLLRPALTIQAVVLYPRRKAQTLRRACWCRLDKRRHWRRSPQRRDRLLQHESVPRLCRRIQRAVPRLVDLR